MGGISKLWTNINLQSVENALVTVELCFEMKREEERVHQFLVGLDDIMYGTMRSNMLTQDPLPALNRVNYVLVQEERVYAITCGKEEIDAVMSFAVHVGYKTREKSEGKDKAMLCSHCISLGVCNESFTLRCKVFPIHSWWLLYKVIGIHPED